MKKISLMLSAVVMTSMLLSSCESNEESASTEVTIGTQVWMTKNLDVATFRNGDPIPEATTEGDWKAYASAEEAAWCYYDNDPKNGKKYGKLYNWYAVNDPRGLAPNGWHLPSEDEWTVLVDYLGGEEKAGAKLKSKIGWTEDGNGTNSSGFSGLPGGNRFVSGSFYGIGDYGYWWSATEFNTIFAYSRVLSRDSGDLKRVDASKARGLSVRCLRD